MNLYIVRHCQTDANKNGVFQGRADMPLNEEGKKQAVELAKKFKNIKIDYILSSPLKRAIETANHISEETKTPIKIYKDLIERSFGNMEGKLPTQEFNIDLLVDFEANYNKNNVETIRDLFKRVYSSIEKITHEYSNKNIVIVTHACVAQAIISYFDEIPKSIQEYTLKNGEIKHIFLN